MFGEKPRSTYAASWNKSVLKSIEKMWGDGASLGIEKVCI
jgi:hypothetical protein